MVRGFNVNQNQVNGSGDSLSEQSRPLLQVEDIRAATGGDKALLESRDLGYFVVEVPNFWDRPEMDGFLRDVREKPDRFEWLRQQLIDDNQATTGKKQSAQFFCFSFIGGFESGIVFYPPY